MNHALEQAAAEDADIVLALDPDADRCAVGTKIDRVWVTLHGDQVGCLLAESVCGTLDRGDTLPGTAPGARTLASSLVSSRLLAAIAVSHGVPHVVTATGFKWIARVPGLAFGYEEAIGYCLAPEIVRDKDGISAALAICELASLLKATGRDLAAAVEDLDRIYGVHVSRPVSLPLPDVAAAEAVLARLLAAPPDTLGGSAVIAVDDLSAGPGGLPPMTGARIVTEAGTRVIVRPSGTEPRVKTYIDIARPPQDNIAAARAAALSLADATAADVEELLRGA